MQCIKYFKKLKIILHTKCERSFMVFFIYFVMLHYILVIYYNKKKKNEPCIEVRDTLTAFAIGPLEILHDARLVWKYENNVLCMEYLS